MVRKHLSVDSRSRSLALYPTTQNYSVKVQLEHVVRVNLLEMYMQVRPGVLTVPESFFDFQEVVPQQDLQNDQGLRLTNLTAHVNAGEYNRQQLLETVEEAMNFVGSQAYYLDVDSATQLLTISANSPFSLLNNSGLYADNSLACVLGFPYQDTSLALTHTAAFPLDTPTPPYVDLSIQEIPTHASKQVRVATSNRTLFTGMPETKVLETVARVPLATTTDGAFERIYYRATECDMITQKFAPTAIDKLTFSFVDHNGRPLAVGEHSLTLMVDSDPQALTFINMLVAAWDKLMKWYDNKIESSAVQRLNTSVNGRAIKGAVPPLAVFILLAAVIISHLATLRWPESFQGFLLTSPALSVAIIALLTLVSFPSTAKSVPLYGVLGYVALATIQCVLGALFLCFPAFTGSVSNRLIFSCVVSLVLIVTTYLISRSVLERATSGKSQESENARAKNDRKERYTTPSGSDDEEDDVSEQYADKR